MAGIIRKHIMELQQDSGIDLRGLRILNIMSFDEDCRTNLGRPLFRPNRRSELALAGAGKGSGPLVDQSRGGCGTFKVRGLPKTALCGSQFVVGNRCEELGEL